MDKLDESKFAWETTKVAGELVGYYEDKANGRKLKMGSILQVDGVDGIHWAMFKEDGTPKGKSDTPHEAKHKVAALFMRKYHNNPALNNPTQK